MKIIIAPDKFKGSLTGLQFCEAVEEGIKSVNQDVEIVKLPLADGGDGTVEALQYYTDGKLTSLEVHDPLMRKIKASYLFAEAEKLAFIEMAEASGIRLLSGEELNPLTTSTYGTGELIADALEKGAEHIILGIGGSATNDAGLGMARALGYQFLDEEGNDLAGIGADLQKLIIIDDSKVNPLLKSASFEIACDVDNPLFGLNGAAHVYGPQKGASREMVQILDKGLQNFNQVAIQYAQLDLQQIEGAGAAGGLGAGAVLFLKAQLKSGISLVKDVAKFDEKISGTDWIITGEGKLDSQTFSGKVIKGVIDSRTNQKLAVLCGFSEIDPSDYEKYGIDFLAETMLLSQNRKDSMENAYDYLRQISTHFAMKHL